MNAFPGGAESTVETAALGEKLRPSPLAALCPGLSENEPPLKGDYLSFRLVLRGRRYEALGGPSPVVCRNEWQEVSLGLIQNRLLRATSTLTDTPLPTSLFACLFSFVFLFFFLTSPATPL